MDVLAVFSPVLALAPAALMLVASLQAWRSRDEQPAPWGAFRRLAYGAWICTVLGLWWPLSVGSSGPIPIAQGGLALSPVGALFAVMVQFLGTVIGAFSSRYLEGEPNQRRYIAGLAGVLAAVHLLLVADHWLLLTAAWSVVGVALQQLLCHYPERPFALLAAHKKRLADRLADGMLLAAAVLCWQEVGSGSLSALRDYLQAHEATLALQSSAVLLTLAVILRTALLPVHGWLIQVMEAPTPVSALLHAGVINLGGVVLIRFAPLLDAVVPARWLLVIFGLGTAVLAGLVMLTRISIKVRLAWSTLAQMGFMVLECGLGLYTLAALHLMGHSIYKAHTFLTSSMVVQQTRWQMMSKTLRLSPVALLLAPWLAWLIVTWAQGLAGTSPWPWWWSAILALAWAPLLWLPVWQEAPMPLLLWRAVAGLAMVAGLTVLVRLLHGLPLGLHDQPSESAGLLALLGLGLMYLATLMLQWRADLLEGWRRWSYAGFYVDEFYTRLALRLWPTAWASARNRSAAKPGL